MSLSIVSDPLGNGAFVKIGNNTVLTFDTTNGFVATPGTGDRSTKIATTQMFANEFPSSLGGTGWQKLPSGLIIQWGTGIAGGTGARYYEIVLPITYPNSHVGVWGVDGGAGCFTYAMSVVSNSKLGWYIPAGQIGSSTTVYSTGTCGVRWISIGY